MMRPLNAFGLVLIIGTSASCRQKLEHPNRSDDTRTRCVGIAANVVSVPRDSVNSEARCALAERAIRALADASPASGLLKADTTEVSRISITPLTIARDSGAADQPTWHITLTLKSEPYDAEVIFNRLTDSVAIGRIHKPVGD
jgi:hypothetical protein